MCPNCRYQNPGLATACPRCGYGSSTDNTVAISTADLPIVASDTERDIVQLSTAATRPHPTRATTGLKTSELVTAATLRRGPRSVAESETHVADAELYLRNAGEEPLPGYVLLHPLGRGGFGEVWKCEAPGGLLKAIKFVKGSHGSDHQLRQEYEAFEQVKAIRHPFLLCLERVEIVGDELVMVMGLADRHIGERYLECKTEGFVGIPRDELISYLREAAEALDVIGSQYGLQHLDVKPANLFLTAGHLQVGDYGLVSKLDAGAGGGQNRGLTPKYAAPEVLRGLVHTQSDQYSLALVYHEMLTGAFPFAGRSAQQMMMQHITAEPDLAALTAADRGPVAKALSKSPDQRFASCLDFIDSFGPTDSRIARRSSAVSTTARKMTSGVQPPVQRPAPEADSRPRLGEIRSVTSCESLVGRAAPAVKTTCSEFIEAILTAAGSHQSIDSAESKRFAEGEWSCRFLTTISPRLAKVKLEIVWEEGGLTMDIRDDKRIVFRKVAPAFRFFGKKEFNGLEVVVELPENGGDVGEVSAVGRIVGTPKQDFIQNAGGVISALFKAIRGVLNNVQDRRKHERLVAEFPVTLTPLRTDGSLEPAVIGRCVDVSSGGLAIRTRSPLPSKYVYVAFEGIPANRGLAVLFQTIKSHPVEDGFIVTGRYRTDL